MLIWDAQNVQTQSGGPGTPGTGCCAQYKITVGVVVMVGFHRVSHGAIIHHRTQGRGNAVKLVFPAHERQRCDHLQRFLICLRKLLIGAFALERLVVGQLVDGHRRPDGRKLRFGQRKLVITGNAVRRRLAAFVNAVIQIMTQQCTLVIAAYGRNIRILCSVVCCIKGRKRSSGKTGLCGQ